MTTGERKQAYQYLDDLWDSDNGLSHTNAVDLLVLDMALSVEEAEQVYGDWLKDVTT